MKYHLIIMILLAISSGCHREQSTQPIQQSPYGLWKSYNVHSYTIDQVCMCYCINAGQTVRITVQADTIAQVLKLSDTSIIANPSPTLYLTIDSLFGIIQNGKNDSIVVQYNAQYGYPESLDINPQRHPVDGGVLYMTSNLQTIKE
jgi:Family of unknown function (DUF6174)